MARAKNTDRSGARRRVREARAAQLAATRDSATATDDDELTDPVTGRRIVPDAAAEADEEPRRSLFPTFRMPNVRRDLADLPQLFRERRLLYVPFVVLLVAFVLGIALVQQRITGEQVTGIVATLVQFTLPPSSLLVFFAGGFIAPRSSYLVGLMLGIVDGILYELLLIATPGVTIVTENSPGDPSVTLQLTPTSIAVGIVYSILIGTIGAAFAAWYRNFLRQSQQRSRQLRVERDAKARAAQKEEARAAKRPAKPASR